MNHHYDITAVVCTRDRNSVVDTLTSVFANRHPHFEVIVVDQSKQATSQTTLTKYRKKHNLSFIQTSVHGVSFARNVGLHAARSPIVAFTDDDCTVEPDWLEKVIQKLSAYPECSLLFTSVLAAVHDDKSGTIPLWKNEKNRVFRSVRSYQTSIHMGAGMATRKVGAIAVGGFDPCLGPGAIFPSAEEYDLALRILLRGGEVHQTPDTVITHHGFRTHTEFRMLTDRDWYGLGGVYAKHLLSKHWNAGYLLTSNRMTYGIFRPLSSLLRFKAPRGLRRIKACFRGLAKGLTMPVDRNAILYYPPTSRDYKNLAYANS